MPRIERYQAQYEWLGREIDRRLEQYPGMLSRGEVTFEEATADLAVIRGLLQTLESILFVQGGLAELQRLRERPGKPENN